MEFVGLEGRRVRQVKSFDDFLDIMVFLRVLLFCCDG